MLSAPDGLVLASQSPRRRQLLTAAGVSFRIVTPPEDAEDEQRMGETVEAYVARLAQQKAQSVVGQIQASEVILACDTVAECEGAVLGKPENLEHARAMLTTMRGREHRVISGVVLQSSSTDSICIANDVTRLRMDSVSDAALQEYLETGLWKGKAGAFGYQDGLDWVHIIEGSESNVVGLPMETLARMFEQWLSRGAP